MNKQNRNIKKKDLAVLGLAASALLILTACEKSEQSGVNLLPAEQEEQQTVNLFSPMEKTEPDTENAARNATDTTVAMVEEKLGVAVAYKTYTAENYKDKTYVASAVPQFAAVADRQRQSCRG